MGYGCMDRLSGKWEFSGQPVPDGEVKDLNLSSDAGGQVKGSATLTIYGNTLDLQVRSLYNGAALEIHLSDLMQEYRFTFSGNCIGGNVFEGPLFGERTFEVKLKYLG